MLQKLLRKKIVFQGGSGGQTPPVILSLALPILTVLTVEFGERLSLPMPWPLIWGVPCTNYAARRIFLCYMNAYVLRMSDSSPVFLSCSMVLCTKWPWWQGCRLLMRLTSCISPHQGWLAYHFCWVPNLPKAQSISEPPIWYHFPGILVAVWLYWTPSIMEGTESCPHWNRYIC